MDKKKISQILSMNATERYRYSIRKICDFEEVWGLFDGGWATAKHENSIAIPFWPEAEFARQSAFAEWEGYQPKSIKLDEFMSKWLPGMSTDKRLVAVFPTKQEVAVYINPENLKCDLSDELSQYE